MKLNGLIDMHCHILPGIDDGSGDFDSSIALSRCYVTSGFSKIAATPHHLCGSAWSATPSKIGQLVDELQNKLERLKIPLELIGGMEIAISDQFWKLLENGAYLPLGNSTTYLLEFPFQHGGRKTMDDFCRTLSGHKDKQFLLAHPERLEPFQNNLKRLELLYNNGCKNQLNIGSFLGWHGHRSQRTAFAIVEQQMCDLISTDCHGINNRDVPTVEQLSTLGELIGEENLYLAMQTNPSNILNNKSLQSLHVDKNRLEKVKTQFAFNQKPLQKKKSSFLKTLTNIFK